MALLVDGELFLKLAREAREADRPDAARRFARRAVGTFEQVLGSDHPDVLRAQLCLAGAREDLADYPRAESDYQRANSILDRIVGRFDDLEVLQLRFQTIRGLARVARARGRRRESQAMLKCGLTLAHQTVGWQCAMVASLLDDVGVYRQHIGRHDDAIRWYRRALAIVDRTSGSGHPQLASILHHMSTLLRATGHFVDGEPVARRLVELRETTLAPDHPLVAAAYAELAAMVEGQGRLAEAGTIYQRAITILDRRFGRDAGSYAPFYDDDQPHPKSA